MEGFIIICAIVFCLIMVVGTLIGENMRVQAQEIDNMFGEDN